MALHPEKYRFDKTLERLIADVEHHHPGEVTISDNDDNDTTTYKYDDACDVSPMRCASFFPVQKTRGWKTSKNDDAQPSKEPFEACMEAMGKMAVDK